MSVGYGSKKLAMKNARSLHERIGRLSEKYVESLDELYVLDGEKGSDRWIQWDERATMLSNAIDRLEEEIEEISKAIDGLDEEIKEIEKEVFTDENV